MILRELPNLTDEAFRQFFYRHWGRENCVVSGRACFAEYPKFQQTLSIKAAFGGRERYVFEHREVLVDDDSYLVVNEDRSYGAVIQSNHAVESFAIFFRPNMAREVYTGAVTTIDRLLDDPSLTPRPGVEFIEHLQPHDGTVTPVLQFIRQQIGVGVDDPLWLEEQLQFLLLRLLKQHRREMRRSQQLAALRPSTRRELHRRVRRATDFILAHYDQSLSLQHMAEAASLSPFHFLRVFSSYHGLTPQRFLERKRVAVAAREIIGTEDAIADIAQRVGLDNRRSLLRTWRRWRKDLPSSLRRQDLL